MMRSGYADLTVRKARALIRHRVRNRLAQYSRQDIWRTAFFIERLDLAEEAFDCQHAHRPNGASVEIGELIGFARDEFADFVLLQDQNAQITLSLRQERVPCESCSRPCELISHAECPYCHRANLYQRAEHDLADLCAKVKPEICDPITRRAWAAMQDWRLSTAYIKLVTCFETLYKSLDRYAFSQECRPPKEPKRTLFQKIRGTQDWFRNHHNVDVLDGVQPEQINDLNRVFCKRHVIVHSGGIVDREYIEQTGDTSQTVGQPIELNENEVLTAARLVEQRIQFARTLFP